MPERIGPYRVEEKIGVGGMGAVYRAWDERLERAVALKRIFRREGPGRTRRKLLAEARATARVSHPNIVQVYDVLEDVVDDDPCDWIVMELVEGPTLRQLQHRGDLEVADVIAHAQGIARGLSAAHGQGIVHRDLKSENVIVCPSGTAKILDFGLAQSAHSDDSSGDRRLRGTPRAMSPEQCLDETIDHRSDIFSFGTLLYECLSGVSPFYDEHKRTYRTLWKVCTHQPERLSDLSPRIPSQLSDLVDRMMAKEADQRPRDVEEVLLELRRIADAPLPRQRVLFVDDEPDFEPLIEQWFRFKLNEKSRYEILFARNGVEALDILREDPGIQLVFTDLNMPEMNGLSLLGEMARLERPRVAVVVSAYGDMKNIRSAMNLGAYDFLTKPLDFKDLEVTLHKASKQASEVREGLRLRAENELLEERNRVIRVAFLRYLRGDPEFGRLFQPLMDQMRSGSEHHVTVLTVEIEGFSELPRSLPPDELFELLIRFVGELISTVQRFRGCIFRFEKGRVGIGFGFSMPHAVYDKQAKSCALALRRTVEEHDRLSREHGGPGLEARLVLDSGDVIVDGRSGELTGEVLERAERQLRECAVGQIMVGDSMDRIDPSATFVAIPKGR